MSRSLNGNGNSRSLLSIPPAKSPTSEPMKISYVKFKSSGGHDLQATLSRVTRHAVYFELHEPEYAPQVSESLNQFVIFFQGKAAYIGHAVVRSLVNTGLTVICEATLREDDWEDSNFILALGKGYNIAENSDAFLKGWQNYYKVFPEFKIVIADMHTFLTDARLWLEQVETSLIGISMTERIEQERLIAKQLEPVIVDGIRNLFEKFEEILDRIDKDLVVAHHAFGKRLVQPLLMSSPFVKRTFTKPLGYAGDYEMVNMMFRDPFDGPSLFAKMVNFYALQLPPIIAHRNRIDYLLRKLESESLRAMRRSRQLKIFNLGCGPAQEVQRFIEQNKLSDYAHFTLVDFNDETLAKTAGLLNTLKSRYSRRVKIQTVKKAVHMLIKSAGREVDYMRKSQYNLIYCAGLFDYLNDQVCQQLMNIFYDMLSPDGLLIATNVDDHPAKNQMECFLEWILIHRNNDKLRSIAPQKAKEQDISITRDQTGVNVFIEVRKPNGEK